jgi:1-acyl-sn-glycerol-3-phosphate acyltransferase
MPDLRPLLHDARSPDGDPALSAWLRLARAARSTIFILVYLAYLILVLGLVQRLIVIPLTWLLPASAVRILGPWVRWNARNTLGLLRVLAGVRVSVEGAIAPGSCTVVMNHQSIIDIAIGFAIVPGPLPLVPTRRRYAWGIPGVSPLIRVARLPLIGQTKQDIKADLAMVAEAAERTRAGETCFFIFPEGHRSRDGSILPFMTRGLTIALSRIPRPVYCVVGDGMWQARTLADTMVRVAGSRIRVRVIGPFEPPQEEADIPAFMTFLRDRMIATLDEMRRPNAA